MVERKTKSARVYVATHNWLSKQSEKTGIPISKLIDSGVELLKKQKNG